MKLLTKLYYSGILMVTVTARSQAQNDRFALGKKNAEKELHYVLSVIIYETNLIIDNLI